MFPTGELGSNVVMEQNPDSYQLSYNLQGNNTSKISFLVGLSQFDPQSVSSQTNWASLILFKTLSHALTKLQINRLTALTIKQLYNNGTYHT